MNGFQKKKKDTFCLIFRRILVLCIVLICFYVNVSLGEGNTIYRFSKDYWENRDKSPKVMIKGGEWEKFFDNESGVGLFSIKSTIDLGMYQFVQIYLLSQEGYAIRWGWSGKKTGDKPYFPSEEIRLINDGKLHVYSFSLRFSDRNNPLFDITDKVWLEIKGITEKSGVELEKLEFIPYDKKHPRQITIGGICMDVLWDEKIVSKIKIEKGMKLVFYTGIYNPVIGAYQKDSEEKDWESDGVVFSIDIKWGNETKRLFHREMKPKIEVEDRNWKKANLDLSEYEGKEVEFIYSINPIDKLNGDFGVWGNPMLINLLEGDERLGTPIFIISCDTLRPDHILPYGYFLPTSPCLDAFAKDAVVFEDAYTTQTFTPVAHMSLLTGLYPEGHGLTRNTDVYPHVMTLPEVMRNHGYITAGFAGFLWWFIPSRGFARGMDLFSVPEEGREGNRRSVIEVCEDAKEWIQSNKTQQIFVFMHNYDIHSKAYGDLIYDAGEEEYKIFSRGLTRPEIGYIGCENIPKGGALLQYIASGDVFPTEEEIDYIRALYNDCVYKVDYALGDFFDFLKKNGLYDSAFIAVVSDHGESLGEHGLYGHDNVYEESMRNVTIVKFPYNKYAGFRVKDRVILEDIVPTILGVINQEMNNLLDGVSLLELIKGGREKGRTVFSSSLRGDMRALLQERFKLLEDIPKGMKCLFDLQKSMAEYYNISSEHPEVFRSMSELLLQKFGLKKEGWWLCFYNPSSFWTGSVNIQSSVPILYSKIQGGVLRTKNERTTAMELKADIFLPKSPTPAIVQIVPVEDRSEIKIHIQKCLLLRYPPNYQVLQSKDEKLFYFSSEDMKGEKVDNSQDNQGFFFWAEYYSKEIEDGRKVVDVSDETQEVLQNLGYLN